MIVKVQLSQFTSDGIRRVFIYNKDRSVEYDDIVGDEIVKFLKNAPKSFWVAKLNKEKKIVLMRKAAWQEW